MSDQFDSLRELVRGQVIVAGDADYEEARAVYNGSIDKHPAAIVRVSQVADVMATVNFARNAGLDLAIRSGGHSAPGFGTCDGGVVIDFAARKGVRVDPETRTARTEPGATWADFNHATHAFGLATTGGIIGSTGVAGLTLGGGIGYLARQHGLSCDNLLSADVVTADGRFVTASAEENADLFWALRGGGGNFGVVTSLEFQLHPVDMIYGGVVIFSAEHAVAVGEFYRDLIASAPEELGVFLGFHQGASRAVPARGVARQAGLRHRGRLDRRPGRGAGAMATHPRRRTGARLLRRNPALPRVEHRSSTRCCRRACRRTGRQTFSPSFPTTP